MVTGSGIQILYSRSVTIFVMARCIYNVRGLLYGYEATAPMAVAKPSVWPLASRKIFLRSASGQTLFT